MDAALRMLLRHLVERDRDVVGEAHAGAAVDKQAADAAQLKKSQLGVALMRDTTSGLHPAAATAGRSVVRGVLARSVRSVPPRLLTSRLVPNVVSHRGVTGRPLGGCGPLYTGHFSDSGALFVSASQDGTVCVLDPVSWKELRGFEAEDFQWTVTSTAVSADDRFVMYTSISPFVHIHDLTRPPGHTRISLASHGGFGIWCSAFSADASEVLVGGSNGDVVIVNVERRSSVAVLHGHDDDVNAICYVNKFGDPNLVASGSDDTVIRVWDRRQPDAVGLLLGHTEGITSLSSRDDGWHLLSNGKDSKAKLWDVRRMAPPSTRARDMRRNWDYRWQQPPAAVLHAVHPDDVSVMTYRGHSVLRTLVRAHFSPVETTGQRYIYTGSADGCVFVFDTLTGDVVQQLRAHTNVVRDVSWHPTRPVLVSSGWDQLLAVWTRRDMTHPQARAAASAAAATNEDLRAGRTAVVARGRHDDDDDGDDEDFQGGDDAEDGDDDDDDDDDDYVALRQQDAPRR